MIAMYFLIQFFGLTRVKKICELGSIFFMYYYINVKKMFSNYDQVIRVKPDDVYFKTPL